jgi:hypothetical protein
MNEAEYKAAQMQLVMLARILADIDLPALQNLITRGHSIGPILAPTMYRDKMGDLERMEGLVQAFIPAWKKANEMRDEFEDSDNPATQAVAAAEASSARGVDDD